jgi:hypothetical protein
LFAGKTGSPLQLAEAANLPEIAEMIQVALANQKKALHTPLAVIVEKVAFVFEIYFFIMIFFFFLK